MSMYGRLKISHHKHTGRLRPHEYTSYGQLMLLLVGVGIALTVSTVSASPGPQAGSIGLSGTVPAAAPKVAAAITSPVNGQHFGATPITIKGTCPENTLVELYKNDIFAGSTPCSDTGSFSLDIDLLIGKNDLIARVYDVLNQPGPDSPIITVYYDALPTQADGLTPLSLGGTQLLLNTDAVYRGVFPGKEMSMPIDILGGTPPYALNIQWGDSTNKIIVRNDNLTFNATHIYKKPGTYQITIQATDANGRVAYLSIAAIVNGQPAVTTVASVSKGPVNKILVLWPLYTSAVAIVVSFWLGERREKKVLDKHNLLLHPQS